MRSAIDRILMNFRWHQHWPTWNTKTGFLGAFWQLLNSRILGAFKLYSRFVTSPKSSESGRGISSSVFEMGHCFEIQSFSLWKPANANNLIDSLETALTGSLSLYKNNFFARSEVLNQNHFGRPDSEMNRWNGEKPNLEVNLTNLIYKMITSGRKIA